MNENERSLKNSRVIVHGISYRGGVKETVNSPSFPLIKELLRWGAAVEVHDPMFSIEEIRFLGYKPFDNNYNGADAIIIVTDHAEYHDLDLKRVYHEMRTPIIVDGRYVLLNAEYVEKFYYAAPGLGLRSPCMSH